VDSGLFHFDISALLTFAAGLGLSAAGYYVRSTARNSRHASIAEAEKRIGSLSKELLKRIDGVKEAVNEVNVTLARTDERVSQSRSDIARLDQRMTALETRCKACESHLVYPIKTAA
jgi:septal ring factor EnvC (AmiA/AmiB activator)